MSETNVIDSPIVCASKQEHDSTVNETITEAIETSATGPNTDLYGKFLNEVAEK